jgi:uncharacterized protein YxjI
MGLRDRAQERREDRREERHGGGAEVFVMREKLVSVGDDFWIETTGGRRAFKVDGKALRVRDTMKLKDAAGTVVAEIQERMMRVRDTMEIDRPGLPSASIKKAMIAPLRERWTITADDLGEIAIQGNLVDHEYTFEHDGSKVAEVSKRWVRVRDTYGVEIQPGAPVALILAATAAIDEMRD